MTIAIHINPKDDRWNRLFNSFLLLAQRHPGTQFIFISDTETKIPTQLPGNCTRITEGPEIRNNLTRHYWYRYKLPSILKRYNAHLMFCSGEIVGLKIKIPQVMVLYGVSKITGGLGELYRKKYYNHAAAIITFSKDVSILFETRRKQYQKKLHVLPFHLNTPESDVSTEATFTSVINPYNIDALTRLLKAFSIFKKWQHSSFKLTLLHNGLDESDFKILDNYKYREDVILIRDNISETFESHIWASFAFIHLYREEDEYFTVTALKAGIPVISTADEKKCKLIFEGAVLAAKETESGLAEQMMRLYKDEQLHRHYSHLGKSFSAPYNSENSLNALEKVIAIAVNETL